MFWQTSQKPFDLLERVLCRFVLQLDGRSVTGFTFMQYQDILGVLPERNQICLPMPGLDSVSNVLRPLLNCNALLNQTPMRPFALLQIFLEAFSTLLAYFLKRPCPTKRTFDETLPSPPLPLCFLRVMFLVYTSCISMYHKLINQYGL